MWQTTQGRTDGVSNPAILNGCEGCTSRHEAPRVCARRGAESIKTETDVWSEHLWPHSRAFVSECLWHRRRRFLVGVAYALQMCKDDSQAQGARGDFNGVEDGSKFARHGERARLTDLHGCRGRHRSSHRRAPSGTPPPTCHRRSRCPRTPACRPCLQGLQHSNNARKSASKR